MKLSKLISLSKQYKAITIMQDKERQFLGTYSAYYSADNLPKFNEDSIASVWDISPKALENWNISNVPIPSYFEDMYPETKVESILIKIIFAGNTYVPISTEKGLMFIDNKYLTPLQGCEDISLFLRIDNVTDKFWVVVKTGLIVVAIIKPSDLSDTCCYKELKKIYIENNENTVERL